MVEWDIFCISTISYGAIPFLLFSFLVGDSESRSYHLKQYFPKTCKRPITLRLSNSVNVDSTIDCFWYCCLLLCCSINLSRSFCETQGALPLHTNCVIQLVGFYCPFKVFIIYVYSFMRIYVNIFILRQTP